MPWIDQLLSNMSNDTAICQTLSSWKSLYHALTQMGLVQELGQVSAVLDNRLDDMQYLVTNKIILSIN